MERIAGANILRQKQAGHDLELAKHLVCLEPSAGEGNQQGMRSRR